MAKPITFYYNPMSRARTSQWMLEEVGVPYETKLINLRKNEQKTPEFLAINPMGKIPAIVHDGVVVTESAAICAYLADAFPEKNLAPPLGTTARGTYFRWLFFTAGCLEAAIIDKVSPRAGEAKKMMLGYGSYEDTLSTLEKAVSASRFVAGDSFTAADVYVGSQIIWTMQFKLLPESPALLRYAEEVKKRPAYARAEEISKTAIAEIGV